MTVAKRALDLAGALVGLVVLSPVLGVVALLVKAGDGGPVLFRQQRVGRDGRLFDMYKFRSMVRDADRAGPLLTIGADPRITRVGRLLRAAKLDELPQLLNVLRGEMSLVGPRPEVPRYVALYTPDQRRVLALVPGITDPASEAYVDEAAVLARAADPEQTYVTQIMPDKLRLNLQYAARATVLSDLRMILRTVGAIAGHRTARP